MPCKLYIDDYYYDGEVWRNSKYYMDRVARDYYKVTYNLTYRGAIWYRYKDNFGEWRFVSKGEYDSASGEKASGGYDDANKVYAYREMVRVFLSKNGITMNAFLKMASIWFI